MTTSLAAVQRAAGRTISIAALCALVACGGGGSASTPPPPTSEGTPSGATVEIAGETVGLQGNVTVSEAAAGRLTVTSDGPFRLPNPVGSGAAFSVSIERQPQGQQCTVMGGKGLAGQASAPLRIECGARLWTIGVTVSGLAGGGTVVLGKDDGQGLRINANGRFAFPNLVADGTSYAVSLAEQPSNQTCSLSNTQGIALAEVTIGVVCKGGTSAPPPVSSIPVPSSAPSGLTVSYAAKEYVFGWNAVDAADYYEMEEDPDGAGPQPAAPVGGHIAATSYRHRIAQLLPGRLNATYRFRACNAGGCGDFGPALAPDVSRAIGYFKASNTQAGDEFGYSLALSADGATLAVGAWHEDGGTTGINGDPTDNTALDSGTVYVFSRGAAGWTQQAYVKASNTDAGDAFGWVISLSASGDLMAVGAPREDSSSRGIDGNQSNNLAADSGAVYLFRRTGTAWAQEAYLKAGNSGAGDQFGVSLALSADGATLAVGAWQEDGDATGINGTDSDAAADSGAAYVFVSGAAGWSQLAYIKASNTGAGDAFGSSVALSADGRTLAVGAYGEDSSAVGINGDPANNAATDSGAVYVFARSGASWAQQAYVKPGNPGAGDQFGLATAMSADGNTLAVGAAREDSASTGINGDPNNDAATDAGAVYVFTRTGTNWAQQAYIKASNAEAQDSFGRAVALSADGNTLAVSAPREDGAGRGVGADAASNASADSGAAYLFERSGTTWTQRAYLKAPNAGAGDQLGGVVFSLGLSGDGTTLAIGARLEDGSATGIGGADNNATTDAGAVYLY